MLWIGKSNPRTQTWLLPTVPIDAHRFRVGDPDVAAALRSAGAHVVDADPEVEITTRLPKRADAPTTVVSINAMQPEGGGVVTRIARRSAASTYVRAQAWMCGRSLRRLGYPRVSTILWDLDQRYNRRGWPTNGRKRTMRELFPQCAVVVGTTDPPSPSLLEASLAAAGEALEEPLRVELILAQEGATIALGDRRVLRATIGPARLKLERQQAILGALHAANPSEAVTCRVPRVLASGQTGLAEWCVETRVPGVTAHAAQITGSFLDECLDFLVALFHVKTDAIPEWTFAAQSQLVADSCDDPRLAAAARDLGERLMDELADLPRGFGHGDFWQKNLLTDAGALTGVVDWDTADGSTPPYLDLFHLRLSARRDRTRQYLGPAVIEELLPWSQSGGDAITRGYGERIGVPVRSSQLEALALAYWLNQVARHYAMFGNRVQRPVWAQRNVNAVLETIRTTKKLA